MSRKEIVGETIAIALVFILLGLMTTIFDEWGNLGKLDTWLTPKHYDAKNLALCLMFSRTLYVYLPTKLGKWSYIISVLAIWAALTGLIMLLSSSFSMAMFILNLVFAFASAFYHRKVKSLLIEPEK